MRAEQAEPKGRAPCRRATRKGVPFTVLVVGGVLLATGCFGSDADTKAESPPTTSKAAPVPSRTPLYPTGSAGCENDLVGLPDRARGDHACVTP